MGSEQVKFNEVISDGEMNAWYNPPRELAGGDESDSVIFTVQEPVSVSEQEKLEVHDSIQKAANPFELRICPELLSAKTSHSTNAVGLFSVDRTYAIEVADFTVLTEPCIKAIQSIIKNKHPDWRIVLFGPCDDCKICIDARSCKVPKQTRGSSLSESLSNAILIQKRVVDATDGEEARQLAVAKNALAQYLALNAKSESAIIAMFDNWRGQKGTCVIWLFHRGKAYHDFSLTFQPGSYGKRFEVSAEGRLFELYELDEKRVGYLVETVFEQSGGFEKTVDIMSAKDFGKPSGQ